MKFYKNINELVESLTKDIITDKYEIEEFDDSYINQLEAIYNSSYFKPCKKAIIDQFISLLNDEDNIKNLLLPKILIDKNINIIYNGVFKEQNHDYEDLLTYGLYHHGYTLDFMYLSNKKSIINKSKYETPENSNIEIDYNYHTNIYKNILYTDYIFNISSLDYTEERFWLRVFRKIILKLEKENKIPDTINIIICMDYNTNYPHIDLTDNDGKRIRIGINLKNNSINIIDLNLRDKLEDIFIDYKNDIIKKEMDKKKYDPVLFDKYVSNCFGFTIYENNTEEKKESKNIFKRLFSKNY